MSGLRQTCSYLAVTWLSLTAWCVLGLAEDMQPGERIYAERCATCHGAQGEGTADNHPEPLIGDKSIAQLTRVITETMPEGEAGTCVGDEARAVAEYIHTAFYSPIAQARLRPPRIDLSRLTNRQYQQSIADLIGSFTGSGQADDRRGLEGDYFDDPKMRRNKRVLERTDPTVAFEFGDASPHEKIGKEEFSMQWQGSVIAADTGDYEFILATENGARLWVNNDDVPLIDAWVRSGDMREYRQTIRLLGGRAYPLRLEFFKFKEPSASIKLMWRPPQHTTEVIPERHLSPARVPAVFVVDTSFPPDDRSQGYERGTSVSKAWDQATTQAALEIVDKLAPRWHELAGTREDEGERAEKLRKFCAEFATRAFRRPLSDDERTLYVDQQFEQNADANTATKRSLLLVLKSPRFLFRERGAAGDQFDRASRLSFALWDSVPDEPLRNAAANGQLATPEQVRQQAERMVNDPRARTKLHEFLNQWLKLDALRELSKDQAAFPEFDAEVISDLRTSLDLFVERVVASEAADFRELLLSSDLYLNPRLAKLYGIELPSDNGFQVIACEPSQRAGVLSHPYLMAGFAYHSTSSPIHRGVFIARSLLGRSLKPPADAVTPVPPDLHPNLTTRERIQLQTEPAGCRSCHAMINPLGFSLEHYDAIGRFRTEEGGRPVDATGFYEQYAGGVVNFTGVRDLATFLAASNETHSAFVEQLFQYAIKQPIRAYGLDRTEQLRNAFAAHNFNMKTLFVEIAVVEANQK